MRTTVIAVAPDSTAKEKRPLLEQLFGTIRLSAKRLNYCRVGADDSEIPAAGLRVLDCLLEGGPQTVPQLARQWSSTRQNLQIIVNRLLSAQLIETAPNPAHKRSGLLKLTPAGEMAGSRVSMQNSSFLGFLAPQFSEGELQTACAVMERLGESIREYCAERHEQGPAERTPAYVVPARQSQPRAELLTEMPVALL